MRVLIDTTYAMRAPHSGTAVYLDRLCEALAERDDVEVVTVANGRRGPPAGGGLGSLRNVAADVRWTSRELSRRAQEEGADVIHHPLPAHSYGSSLAQVITIHDLAFERLPDGFAGSFRAYARVAHRTAGRAADAVIAVSETTAAEARSRWGLSGDRIVVAPHGPGQRLARYPGSSAPAYFLYVGDAEPRKDLPTLLTGYGRYRRDAGARALDLVLAGALSGSDGGAPGVRTEPTPSPEQLARLYAGAAALVHASRYEGFGLTPLEAMSLGVPVVAARSPGVVEVCADAARYFVPGDAAGLAAALVELGSGPRLRTELSGRGRRRATRFSWSLSAQRHLDAYSLALRS